MLNAIDIPLWVSVRITNLENEVSELKKIIKEMDEKLGRVSYRAYRGYSRTR